MTNDEQERLREEAQELICEAIKKLKDAGFDQDDACDLWNYEWDINS